MAFNKPAWVPAEVGAFVHAESGLMVIANPTIDQVIRNRAIMVSLANGARFAWFAGVAFVDLLAAAKVSYGKTSLTLDELSQFAAWHRKFSVSSSDQTDAALGPPPVTASVVVHTFKHGFYSGCGATHWAASTPSAVVASSRMSCCSPGLGFSKNGVNGTVIPEQQADNCAYVMYPTELSVLELGRRMVANMTGWKPDARSYISGELVKFLQSKGFTETQRAFEPMLFAWGSDHAVRHIPPSLLQPTAVDPSGNLTPFQWTFPNLFGGRIRMGNGTYVHLPWPSTHFPPYVIGSGDGINRNYASNPSTSLKTSYSIVPGSVSGSNSFSGCSISQIDFAGVDITKVMSGQPFAYHYDVATKDRLALGTTAGEEILSNAFAHARASLTLATDSTKSETALAGELSVNGQVDATKVVAYLDSNSGGYQALTNYDTVAFTARTMARIVNEAVRITSTKVVFDATRAQEIITGWK